MYEHAYVSLLKAALLERWYKQGLLYSVCPLPCLCLYFPCSHLVCSLLSYLLPCMNFCSLINVHLPTDFSAPLDSSPLDFPCSLHCCCLGCAAQISAAFSLFSPSLSALYLEVGSLIPTPGGKPYHHRLVNINCTYK